MATTDTSFFDSAFRALTGNDPFPWQRDLFKRLMAGEYPDACKIPTGLGKTAIIAIWLIVLANHAKSKGASLHIPRRLVYVVNRRTVVDQSTSEAETFRQRLQGEGELPDEDRAVLKELRRLLQNLFGSKHEEVLAISTLRGQFADNGQWCADPARPAIIVGTVDMIGSRLLFSGYGRGYKTKPLHAGFLGQDVLLIHDEAHLEPAFQKLLAKIENEQRRCKELQVFKVIELSATSRWQEERSDVDNGKPFGLTEDEKGPPTKLPKRSTKPVHVVWQRLKATKTLLLHENSDEKKLADEVAELALKHEKSGCAVLVFVWELDNVEKVLKKLAGNSTEQLTGTLRGLERDRIVESPVFQRFLPESNRDPEITPAEGTVYLVCTSAGEVGVDISADHLVCDLTPLDSMVQRFGRVNRFGTRDDTRIDVVHPVEFGKKGKVEPIDQSRQKTLELLKRLEGERPDVGPLSLIEFGERRQDAWLAAFSPAPAILPATDILFDAWALTSIRKKLPGRPPVEPYLHGIRNWEAPETHVAWREDISVIHELHKQYKPADVPQDEPLWPRDWLPDACQPEDLLDDYPLRSHELLRDRTYRVFKQLKAINKNHADKPVWLVQADGSVEISTLGAVVGDGSERLNDLTILLPPEVGGLSDGRLDGSSPTADDVADEWYQDKQSKVKRRIRLWDNDVLPDNVDLRWIRTIDIRPFADEENDGDEGPSQTRRFWYWYEQQADGDGAELSGARKAIRLSIHARDTTERIQHFVETLDLPEEMKKALVLAAKLHDLGKRREVWQRSIGNMESDPAKWLAKSGAKRGPCRNICPNYRHEFGSLLDVVSEKHDLVAEWHGLGAAMQDLVLHLIAAHHGRARPHFSPKEAYDFENHEQDTVVIAAEVSRRFARLQRKYGRWGLAYLESLLRAADYAASAEHSVDEEE